MNNRIPETICFPVRYDNYGTCIFDANNNKIIDVRGWGYIQYLDNPEERQDEIGEWLELVMNNDWGG